MKYEMIFGDKNLADKFTNERSVFIVERDGVYFEFEDGSAEGINNIANFCAIGDRYYMRRIIEEPNRWTVEDQKAGMLPGVGAKYDMEGCVVEHLGNGAAGYQNMFHFRYPSGACGCAHERLAKPLETPEEKAERLRNEWINEAINAVRKTDVNGYESIYDALLSGALSVPTKGGE